ncbi:MAG: AAA family ATPase [Cyanobacteria bacterium P01_D01_bin.44]
MAVEEVSAAQQRLAFTTSLQAQSRKLLETSAQVCPHQFVNTSATEQLSKRTLRYLQAGYSVHLKGATGTGKTTLAMHLANLIGRPMLMLFGNDSYYIHSSTKVEDGLNWLESQLLLACRKGFTLIYDEFNRSRPEVNNVLLSVLEERRLTLPPNGNGPDSVRVHPNFRMIFTSNPEEYCGVYTTQDALLDRLITLHLPEPDALTQQQILVQKTGLDAASALLIVQLVRQFLRQLSPDAASSLRPCLMIAEISQQHEIQVSTADPDFRDVCRDILLSRAGRSISEANEILWTLFNRLDRLDYSDGPIELLTPAPLIPESLTPEPAVAETPDPSLPESTSDMAISTVPPEDLIHAYLQTVPQAGLAQIERQLNLKRGPVINGLRALMNQGRVEQHDLPGEPSAYRANSILELQMISPG